ncbi:unknown [Haloarcula marismortui ATCC 43049]|uniref:Fucosyltransferase C-terminal domain-containing protein n=1 Tax=Haloarcula marismortui (strain ATCC 43049 / DSM 3752 / JCM 8966 / VKM B-1809) TaxID=272569 RepID=Q5V1V8_HALMA|nr:glycosyltransferase family 10 [Haloarcula marismortui]AAV46494.1 unknown [Haloarcula marismortui ATCC 43049]QCP91215.1 hypothetical protein E6P14_10245 [Haloarcula marismortui ATCC 43049]
MKDIYFDVDWTKNKKFVNKIKRQTPSGNPTWGNIQAVDDIEMADYHVIFNYPTIKLGDTQSLIFSMEPPNNPQISDWKKLDVDQSFPISEFYFPQYWKINKSYTELKNISPPEKTKDLSWITSNKGQRVNKLYRVLRWFIWKLGYKNHETKQILRGPLDGHLLRMRFLDWLAKTGIDFDLYGRGNFNLDQYRGEIKDKWSGLSQYRYTLAIENYKGKNYFSEKISDALLAWTMPIYWGCTNLSDFLPEDSYIRIDIEDPSAPKKISDIVQSNIREKNIDAIAEARERILDRYQVWPTVQNAIENHKIQTK